LISRGIHVEEGEFSTPEATSDFEDATIVRGGGGEEGVGGFEENSEMGGPGDRTVPLLLVVSTGRGIRRRVSFLKTDDISGVGAKECKELAIGGRGAESPNIQRKESELLYCHGQ